MLWLKRIICGIVALIFIFIGARLIHGGEQVWQAIGFCILVGGIDVYKRQMLTSLDPHSSYLDADSFNYMSEQTKGKFGGLGIEVTMDNGCLLYTSCR